MQERLFPGPTPDRLHTLGKLPPGQGTAEEPEDVVQRNIRRTKTLICCLREILCNYDLLITPPIIRHPGCQKETLDQGDRVLVREVGGKSGTVFAAEGLCMPCYRLTDLWQRVSGEATEQARLSGPFQKSGMSC